MKGGFYTHHRQMAEITWSTLIMTANKKATCPSAFGKRYKNDYIAAGATGYEAQANDTT